MAKNQLTAVDRRKRQMQTSLRNVLESGRERYQHLLPRHMTPDRMIHVALTATTQSPKLLDCSAASLGSALLTASQMGLEPDGYHGHLIPYGKTCQFIPDYKGLIQLALHNDVVISAHAVYENDKFAYQLGLQPSLVHEPYIDGDRGELRCAYAIATFKDGRTQSVVATRADIEKRRKASASADKPDSPWVQWPEEMAIKTSVKMLMKYVPRSPEMTTAVTADDMAEMGRQQQPMEVPGIMPEEEPDRQNRNQDALERMNTNDKPNPTLVILAEALEQTSTPDDVSTIYKSIITDDESDLSEETVKVAREMSEKRISELKNGQE